MTCNTRAKVLPVRANPPRFSQHVGNFHKNKKQLDVLLAEYLADTMLMTYQAMLSPGTIPKS